MVSGKRKGFAHLHVHSEYSLLDGAARIPDLVARTKELGMEAIAITDHGVMYGVLDFYKECKQAGVKPIIGCEVYLAPRTIRDKTPHVDDALSHLTLLAENNAGYSNLVKLASIGFLEGFYYKPRVDLDLLKMHAEGIICLTGCPAGKVPSMVLKGDMDAARRSLMDLMDAFGSQNLFLEMQDHGTDEERIINAGLAELSRQTGVRLVATNDCHYVYQSDSEAHDVLLCIQTAKSIDDSSRLRFPNDQFYLKSPEEMSSIFSWAPDAIENSVAISERCNVQFDFGQIHLPRYPVPGGFTASSYLRKLCNEMLPSRYPNCGNEVLDRLEYELEVIERMGYADYFLIVWDFIKYARERGIPVGPGRGSAAGSMVAYVLGITNIDPLKYGLLFERFLNPERVTMPDMDIDFCFERRNEVVDYVVRRYGQDHVAQIITFGTMAARAAIRDVGRALGMPYGAVDKIAKQVPFHPGMTIQRALEVTPELMRSYQEDVNVRRLLDLARALEGLPRHASVHAAGVVISKDPITHHVPLQRMPDNTVVTQFSMESLEQLGLLKMDFLGLRTLTVIHDAIEQVKVSKGVQVDLDNIPLDDPDVYKLLGEADCTGVFQLESGWVRDTLKELKPEKFEDLIAAVALVRPGPMENIPEFIKNKREGTTYPHPLLEPILKETYGIMIYQEQAMQAVSAIAGFTLGQADVLRRGMGKKKPELIAGLKADYLRGAQERGISLETAENIFQLIEKFAGYGFNKSHGAAYALIAYQTAYLRTHWYLEYMAALLTSVMGNTDKVTQYIEDCRRHSVEVLPPDINESEAKFTVVGDKIRFGLAAIKNVGKGAIDSILEARSTGGPFKSLKDFCSRVDTRLLNRRAIESLIKAGAFDSLGAKRSQLMAILDDALNVAQSSRRKRDAGQVSFFELSADARFGTIQDELPNMDEYPKNRLLQMEKEVLGLYISGHPLAHFLSDLRTKVSQSVSEIKELNDGSRVVLGGYVVSVKRISTKSGGVMAFVNVEDLTGAVEVTVFPKTYEKSAKFLTSETVIIVKGRVSIQEDQVKVIADEVVPVVRKNKVYVRLSNEAGDRHKLEELKQVCIAHHGECPLYFRIFGGKRVVLASREYWVDGSAEVVERIEELLGPGSVELEAGI